MRITREELKGIVANLCAIEPDAINDKTLLVGELKMDSIKIVELLAILSEEYDLHATEEEAANFDTFKNLYDFTQKV